MGALELFTGGFFLLLAVFSGAPGFFGGCVLGAFLLIAYSLMPFSSEELHAIL